MVWTEKRSFENKSMSCLTPKSTCTTQNIVSGSYLSPYGFLSSTPGNGLHSWRERRQRITVRSSEAVQRNRKKTHSREFFFAHVYSCWKSKLRIPASLNSVITNQTQKPRSFTPRNVRNNFHVCSLQSPTPQWDGACEDRLFAGTRWYK